MNYQDALESVLAWLLDAEDTLHKQAPISEDVQEVKQQFHEHEVKLPTAKHQLYGEMMFYIYDSSNSGTVMNTFRNSQLATRNSHLATFGEPCHFPWNAREMMTRSI